MGSMEYIIVLCFVITIWSNSVNADIDCKRFVFHPMCRGVSAKRAELGNHDSHGATDLSNENPIEEMKKEFPSTETRQHRKRFTDLLKKSLLRRTRSKDLARHNILLQSIDELFGSNDLDE